MNAIVSGTVGAGLFFILIFFSGFWLHFSGKPYRVLLFNAHKLIALSALVLLGLAVNKIHQTTPLTTVQIVAVAVSAAGFVITIVTGGLSNIDKALPIFIYRLHHIMPYLTVISSAVSLTLLLRGEKLLAM